MRKLWFLIGVCFVIVGCSTTQTSMSDARPVPPAFVYADQNSTASGDAKLTVIRDSGYIGSGCRFGLFVDGQRVADLESKEMVTVSVKAGQRLVGAGAAKDSRGLCLLNNGGQLREREATFDPGQERYFRISLNSDGDLDISPISKP